MNDAVPFIRPNPFRLSELADELRDIERSGRYSNFGQMNTRFCQRIIGEAFDGAGHCLTVCNATIGLMLAIKEAVSRPRRQHAPYALMPSFTFAATAHAAQWCGLTPLFCDIDPDRWTASAPDERQLLERFGDEIAVIVPYATFGAFVDLDRYRGYEREFGIPTVVDAAASLVTRDAHGVAFGRGSPAATVFSMQVTKAFATSEGGLIYSADADRVKRLERMSNFGFGAERIAEMPALNAKLPEVSALLALKKLDEIEQVTAHRMRLYARYRDRLPDFTFQELDGCSVPHQFAPALVPGRLAACRDNLVARLKRRGIETGRYFSPHLARHPQFARHGDDRYLPHADAVAGRVICLPLHDTMAIETVDRVAGEVRALVEAGVA